MLDFVLWAKMVLAGGLVAAAVMTLASWRSPSTWRSSARWSWAVGAGVWAAGGVGGEWPHWPALEDRARFLSIVVPLCVAVETLAAGARSVRVRWLLRWALAAAVAPTLLHNTVYLADLGGPGSAEWSTAQATIILSALAALLFGVWVSMHQLQRRTSPQVVPWLLVLNALAAAVTVMLSSYYRGGLLGLGLAAALAGATLATHFGPPRPRGDARLGLGVIGVFSVVLIGRYFGALPTVLAAGLLLAPLLAWMFELPKLRTLPPAWRTAGRCVCVAMVLAMVVAVAYGRFVEASRTKPGALSSVAVRCSSSKRGQRPSAPCTMAAIVGKARPKGLQMADELVLYMKRDGVATITLNRADKANTLRFELIEALGQCLADANRDAHTKVIVLQGAGDNFCGGFDFSDGLAHYEDIREEGYDPGADVQLVVDQYRSYLTVFMGLWRGAKPSIAKVQGYCVGGGSELALCADLVVAADDARFGTPYSRVWGCHLTGMWVYRLGLAKAKYYALTGDSISGKEAAEIELINFSYPLNELDDRVGELAERLTRIPTSQLVSMKLIVNQAYDNLGLQSTQTLGPILDGIMRNTPEGREFVRVAQARGVREAITQRDAPFGDYSQAPRERQPKRKRDLG